MTMRSIFVYFKSSQFSYGVHSQSLGDVVVFSVIQSWMQPYKDEVWDWHFLKYINCLGLKVGLQQVETWNQ